MATPDEQARELAEELGLTHRMEIAMLASALRQREAETWKQVKTLITRADSLLSLLWHRHVPPDRKDSSLAYGVEQTIGLLRARAAQPQESGKLLPPSPL